MPSPTLIAISMSLECAPSSSFVTYALLNVPYVAPIFHMHIYDVSYSPTFYNLLLAQSPTCSAYIGGPYGGSHTNFISVLSKVRKFLS